METWRPSESGSTPESKIAIVTPSPLNSGYLARKDATPVSFLGTKFAAGNCLSITTSTILNKLFSRFKNHDWYLEQRRSCLEVLVGFSTRANWTGTKRRNASSVFLHGFSRSFSDFRIAAQATKKWTNKKQKSNDSTINNNKPKFYRNGRIVKWIDNKWWNGIEIDLTFRQGCNLQN